MRLSLAVLLVIAAALTLRGSSADPAVGDGPPPPPSEYSALFGELSTNLAEFQAQVHAQWDGSTGPAQFAGGLAAANGNKSVGLLSPATWTRTVEMLDAFQAMGVTLVKVDMQYPVLTPAFHDYLTANPPPLVPGYSYTVDNFIGYPASFYSKLAAEIRTRGMGLWIEHSTLFDDFSPTPPSGYFAGIRALGLATAQARYTAEQQAEAVLIVSELAPDYYTIADEPTTQDANFGYLPGSGGSQVPIFTPDEWGAFVQGTAAAIRAAAPTAATLLGAGSGTWETRAYTERFAALPELDYIDFHMYPLETPFENYLQNALDWADYVRGVDPGKKLTLGEAWLYKVSSAELVSRSIGANDIFGRDVYNFWEPLDRQMLEVLYTVAHFKGFEAVMPFWTQYFFAYLTYGDPSLDGLSSIELLSRAGQDAVPNIAGVTLTGTGQKLAEILARAPAGTPTFHCAWDASCPEIAVAGDPPATLGGGPAPFRGYGDPSLELDPETGELWMAYSWLDVNVSDPGPPPVIDFGVRTHLAKSVDGGATFQFVREVNATSLIQHPDSGADGWSIHEVPTITRKPDGTWEALWLTYFDSVGGAIGSGHLDFYYTKSTAAAPDGLGDSVVPWIRGSLTSPSFGAVHNLSAMPQLAGCTTFTEPSLITRGGETYLATNCVVFIAGVRRPDLERLVLLREDGGGYDYIGELLDHDDAVDNGGERIEQADLVVAQNGAVLLIGTPIQAATPNHLGCVVFEVTDPDTASVRRDGSGTAVKVMEITGDDPLLGAGLCTYNAESATGVVMVLHDQDPPTEVVFSMRATGQHPQGLDSDTDGRADTADNCPAWPNPAQALPSWSVPAGDPDCDGFAAARESLIGTDSLDACNSTAAANDEPMDAWPPDFNDNRSTNIIDIIMLGPAFNTSPPNPAYNARFDLDADNNVNIIDVIAMGPFFNRGCTP